MIQVRVIDQILWCCQISEAEDAVPSIYILTRGGSRMRSAINAVPVVEPHRRGDRCDEVEGT